MRIFRETGFLAFLFFSGLIAKAEVRSFEGHYYEAFVERVNWQTAKARCEELGGYLVCVESETELDFVFKEVGKGLESWLGGINEGGKWKWINGAPFKFTKWHPGRPREDSVYLHLSAQNTWDGSKENATRQIFICEWDQKPDRSVSPVKSTAEVPQMKTISGSENAAEVPIKLNQTAVTALLVVELNGMRYAGQGSKMTAIALPTVAGKSATVSFNQPVGNSMGTALEEVQKFLQLRHSGWPKGKGIEISFQEKYSLKDGPSAALPCAIVLNSLITGDTLDSKVALTGDLNVDGSVQPIGGVAAKIRGAAKSNCKLVGIPSKNVVSVLDLIVREGDRSLIESQIFEIADFDTGYALAKSERSPELQSAISDFEAVQEVFKRPNSNSAYLLNNGKVKEKLKMVLKNAPNHLSAKLLLLIAAGNSPKQLSIGGSVESIDQTSYELINAMEAGDPSKYTSLGKDVIADSLSELQRLRQLLDQKSWAYADALARFGRELQSLKDSPPKTKNAADKVYSEIKGAADSVNFERGKLLSMPDVIETLIN